MFAGSGNFLFGIRFASSIFPVPSDGPESTNSHHQSNSETGQCVPIQPEQQKMRFAFGLKYNADKPPHAH